MNQQTTTILFAVRKPGHSAWSKHTDLDEALAERQCADNVLHGHKVYRVIGNSVKGIRA